MFCAVFAWCSPEVYRDLDALDSFALRPVASALWEAMQHGR